MKKYLLFIIIIIVLAAMAIWFVKNQSPERINLREGNFALGDRTSITKIILDDTEKKHIELDKTDEGWQVNNKFEARAELIQRILDVITRIQSLAPVPQNAHDNVVRDLMTHHIKVQVFTNGESAARIYYVGGPTNDSKGTYMLLELNGKMASRAHIVFLPGYRGYLTPLFNTDEEQWRSKLLFNYTRANIRSLSVTYPGTDKNSFQIKRVAEDSFSVNPIDEKFRINETYEQKYVRQYLDFYSSVSIEAFDNSYSKKDSMNSTLPYCYITITDKDNTVLKTKLYRMPISKRSKSQYDYSGMELTYDVDRFYASFDKDFAIVQYYVFGKLLRAYPDFYYKPK